MKSCSYDLTLKIVAKFNWTIIVRIISLYNQNPHLYYSPYCTVMFILPQPLEGWKFKHSDSPNSLSSTIVRSIQPCCVCECPLKKKILFLLTGANPLNMKHINIDIVTELVFPLANVELPVLFDMRVLNVIPHST